MYPLFNINALYHESQTWGSVISPVKHNDGWATQPRRSALSAATTAPWLALTMPYIASVLCDILSLFA